MIRWSNHARCSSSHVIQVEDGYRVRLPEKTIRAVLAEIVVGLEGMHLRGVLHRDLKPENILVDSNGASLVFFVIFDDDRSYLHCGLRSFRCYE